MAFNPGDDVWVEFEHEEHPGEVLKVENGWVMATIQTDPDWDYGSLTARMAPHQTVAVKLGRVRERIWEDTPKILGSPESETVQ
mgnify:CR=1 FL=1